VAPDPRPALRFHLLGGLVVERDGVPLDLGGRKQRAVLAALLLELDRPVSADRLIDRVWGDDPPGRAAVSLQAYVSKLRNLLEPERREGGDYAVLRTEPAGYRLVAARVDVDLARFEDLCAEAAASDDPAGIATAYEGALALTGPLIPELAGEPWVVDAATRVDTARADALEGAYEARLAQGRGRELVPGLEAAVADHPYRERLRMQLALALYRSGRQTDALRSLAEARRVLADEIGVEPGPELQAVESDILAHAPHLESPVASPSAPPSSARSASGAPPDGSTPGAVPLRSPEAPVHGTAGAPLVGRTDELATLVGAATRAAAGRGSAVVVSGEAGIGKTRLVEELVAAPEAAGFVVGWARCHESASGAPYWGYTQIAEQILDADLVSVASRAGISAVGGGVHTIDPAADRHALHASMVAALRSVTRPMLILVDDLQWADASSLRVLELVTTVLPSIPVLVVATVRPVGPDAPTPLVACLSELARVPGARRVELAGLSVAEVATWLDRRGPATAGPDVARLVHERTGGNPFFLGEVIELLAQQDHADDAGAAGRTRVPAAALDVVRRRVGLLPADAQRLLSAASVVGIDLDLDVLGHVAGLSTGEALDGLDPAVTAGLLREDDVRPGRLRYAHALVAEALVAELSPARRARLHVAIVAALEELRSPATDDDLARLVHHAREGAVAGSAVPGFRYAVRAAEAASARGAVEVAAARWEDAHGLLDLAHPGDAARRYEVLVALGRAREAADDQSGAQQALLAAIEVARAVGDDDAVRGAAAALAATTLWQPNEYGEVNVPLVRALEAALATPGGGARADAPESSGGSDVGTDETDGEQAVLLGALADALYYGADTERPEVLSTRAVAAARRTGDANRLALALSQRFRAVWRGPRRPEQATVAEEMRALAAAGRLTPGLTAVAHLVHALTSLMRGDAAAFARDLDAARAAADRSHLPGLVSQVGWADAGWSLARGRYDDANRHARDAHALYRRTRGWQADDIIAAFDLAIAHDRGELHRRHETIAAVLDGRFDAAAREIVGWMHVDAGDLHGARDLVGPTGGAPDLPQDWLWIEATTAAAHVRAALGDIEAATVLYRRLAPETGRMDVTAGAFLGGVDLALAVLAEALEDADAACRHVDDAIVRLEAMGTRPALARALVVRGRLRAAGDADDRAAGVADLDRAVAVARDLGLVPVLDAVDRIQAASKVAGG
jgi:DNA-binding SARP family transcriptional activator/nucleoside-triphosphatase THEP1